MKLVQFALLALCVTVATLAAVNLVYIPFADGYMSMKGDYVAKRTVGGREFLREAISNAVESVESRNFVVVGLEVVEGYGKNRGTWTVKCAGVEPCRLSKGAK